LYFPMKVAVARLGGIKAASEALGIGDDAVQAFVSPTKRTKPSDTVLVKLSRLSGVSLSSFFRYFERLEQYRSREKFRRR